MSSDLLKIRTEKNVQKPKKLPSIDSMDTVMVILGYITTFNNEMISRLLMDTEKKNDSTTGVLKEEKVIGGNGSRPVRKHFTALIAACLIVFLPGVSGLKVFTTTEKSVIVGDSFLLECNEGDRWFREERKEIHPGGHYQVTLCPPSSTLTVINATVADGGMYECCLFERKDEMCYKGHVVVHPKPPCEPFETPPGMWSETNSSQLQVGCKHNGNEWSLTCIRGEWTGEYGPCPLEWPPCEPFEAPAGMWADTSSTQLQVGCKQNDDEWSLTCIRGEWTGEYGPCPLERPPCEPFEAPAGMWADTSSTQLQVGCKQNDDEWSLTCIRGEWTGEYGPCPLERPACQNETVTGDYTHLKYNIYKTGFIVCVLVILFLILFCLCAKRKWTNKCLGRGPCYHIND